MESPPRIVVPPEATAAGPTPQSVPPRIPDGGESGPFLQFVVFGGIALISVGVIIYALGQRGSSNDDGVEVEVLNDPTTIVAPRATNTTIVATSTTATAPTTTVATSRTSATAADPVVLEGPPQRETGTVRQAVLADGILYLRGRVPSEDFGGEIVRRAELVVGSGNVVNQYEIDTSAPPVDSAPLYVADTLLFTTGGLQINPAFLPLLDLGTTLLSVNDNVTITVVAHTDSAGSAALNQRLSQQRAEVVRQYWIEQGVDPSRIEAVGRGEAEPIADNATPEGKQLNRRAEFIVTGILG